MVFVKIVKNKAYFKRFQVKYRRRREGKTDYKARRLMVLQDKTKFGTPKYRFVVRITNRDIIAQIVHAKVKGDQVVTAAYAHELPAYGIKHGLTNYCAAYATGLLCARRLLTKLKIADKFEGVKTASGEHVPVITDRSDVAEGSKVPFKAILDVGLSRTTTGARVFGCMKGAVDGGVAIPHRPNRFPGFNKTKKELDSKAHRSRIFGKHVAEYMKKVKESGAGETNMFSKMLKDNVTPASLESTYLAAHTAIRANPNKSLGKKSTKKDHKSYKIKKATKDQKVENARRKVATLRKAMNKDAK